MSKTASKTAIGAFVLCAIALVIVAVIVFGSGKYFKKALLYQIYFEGSVQGLVEGAPVLFRGVQIGTVTNISLQLIPATVDFRIPVIIEIYPERAKRLGPPPKVPGELFAPMIKKGLRAQLITQSMITGQLAVALDFFPEEPAKFVGTDLKYPEIPSIPSKVEALTKELQELPIKEILMRINSAVTGIDTFINSGSAQANMKELEKLTKRASELLESANTRINPLITSLQSTSDQVRSTMEKLNGSVSGNGGVLETSRSTMVQAEKTLHALQQIAQENSAMGQNLSIATEEMSRSLRSLRLLSDYLERHPEALLRGKP